MSPKISKGILLARNQLTNICIPDEVLSKLTAMEKNFLVIFMPRADDIKISIIPCEAPEVLKILVHLIEFSPQTVKSIADIIYEMKISTIHTSGICFHNMECCYEAYVEISNENKLEEIKKKFIEIPECKGVDLEIVKIE